MTKQPTPCPFGAAWLHLSSYDMDHEKVAAAVTRFSSELLGKLKLMWREGRVRSGAFTVKRTRELFVDPAVRDVTIWGEAPACQQDYELRPNPKIGLTFQHCQMAVIAPAERSIALLALVRELCALLPVIQGFVAGFDSFADANRELLRSVVSSETYDDDAFIRLKDEDRMTFEFYSKVRRIYPVTIVGQSLRPTLDGMPAGPVIETVGDCTFVTTSPALTKPRDPAFLAATRELRAWYWPHTIQNPADSPDLG